MSWTTALGILGVVLVFGTLGHWVRAVRAVRVSPNLRPVRWALAGGGLCCAIALVAGTPGFLGTLCALAFFGAGAFLGLDRIAALPRQTPAVRVGAPAPRFTAISSEGATFDLASLPPRPVLLKFFRGWW